MEPGLVPEPVGAEPPLLLLAIVVVVRRFVDVEACCVVLLLLPVVVRLEVVLVDVVMLGGRVDDVRDGPLLPAPGVHCE